MGAFKAAREAYDEHEKGAEARRPPQGRRPHRRHLSLHRRVAVDAAALGRVHGRIRRRARTGPAARRRRGVYVGDNQEEARFTLVVLYNREKQFDEALAHLATLRERYPQNRLAWLESGSTSLRAGKTADAERFLDEGMRMFANDTRPRMFGEDALWYLEARHGAREPGPHRARRGPIWRRR